MNSSFWMICAVVLLTAVIVSLFTPSRNSNSWRLARLEKKVDLLMKRFDIEYVDSMSETIRRYLMEGKKIEAIRVFRELNPGASLHEAKSAVESIAQTINQ